MAATPGKKILMVSYLWPPFAGVGMYRALKFARYLTEFGWNPTIVTPRSLATNFQCPPEDGDIKGVDVIRTDYTDILEFVKTKIPTLGTKKQKAETGTQREKTEFSLLKRIARDFLTIPDENRGWYKPAVQSIEEAFMRERFDAIYSTSPPETSHLIAKTTKIKHDIPWVADLRDPWAFNHYTKESAIKNFILKQMERRTLCLADAIVVVSDPWRDTFRALYPKLRDRVHTITNSFDETEIEPRASRRHEEFVITYTGKIHRDFQNPEPFFKALGRVIRKEIIERKKIKARFYTYGYHKPELSEMAERCGVKDIVEISGYVPHKESVSKQLESTALLFIDWRQPKSMYSTIVCTHKVYEYIGARRPILVISATGNVASQILESSGAARLAREEEDVERVLTEWFTEFRETGKLSYKGDEETIKKYSASTTTSELARLLDSLGDRS